VLDLDLARALERKTYLENMKTFHFVEVERMEEKTDKKTIIENGSNELNGVLFKVACKKNLLFYFF
jgi:PBP1b-binding outer membrane lipoprotein LpoB